MAAANTTTSITCNPNIEGGAQGAGIDDVIATAIDELFNLRAFALAARAVLEPATDPIPDNPEEMRESLQAIQDAGGNARRIMLQLADKAQDLARRLDDASLADTIARRKAGSIVAFRPCEERPER